MTESGVLLVDKPGGVTSHQVVARLRRIMGTRKVGHAGTLDPMATGMLIVGFNKATRLLGYIAGADKSYEATIRLGQATITDDAEGEITSTCDTSGITDDAIAEHMTALTGDIMQIPSKVSAIKVNGQRSYARVRAGEDVTLAARPVTVSRFDTTDIRRTEGLIDVDVVVDCSTGTYIRALARDLGAALGVGGHLVMLRRTRIASFTSDEMVALDEIESSTPLMTMADAARQTMPIASITEAEAIDVRYGRRLARTFDVEPTALINAAGELVALYDRNGAPVAVFVS